MNADGSIVVYDILRDGIGFAPIGVSLGALLGMCVGLGGLISYRKQRKPVAGIVVWLMGWTICTLVGVGNVWRQHFRCVAWARSGDFEVVEGRVTYFDPLLESEKGSERFTVKGVTFSYSSADLGQGGFRYDFGPDGLLQVGTQVRVSHRDGRILKLEILQQ